MSLLPHQAGQDGHGVSLLPLSRRSGGKVTNSNIIHVSVFDLRLPEAMQ